MNDCALTSSETSKTIVYKTTYFTTSNQKMSSKRGRVSQTFNFAQWGIIISHIIIYVCFSDIIALGHRSRRYPFRAIADGDRIHVRAVLATWMPIGSSTGSRNDNIEYVHHARSKTRYIQYYYFICSGINPTAVAVTSPLAPLLYALYNIPYGRR